MVADDGRFDNPFDDDEWDDLERIEEEAEAAESAALQGILREMGIDDASEVLVNLADIDPANLRGQRFDSIEEAIYYLYEIGVLAFSDIVEMEDGTYAPLIGDSTRPSE